MASLERRNSTFRVVFSMREPPPKFATTRPRHFSCEDFYAKKLGFIVRPKPADGTGRN
jgi:hypothetical protein